MISANRPIGQGRPAVPMPVQPVDVLPEVLDRAPLARDKGPTTKNRGGPGKAPRGLIRFRADATPTRAPAEPPHTRETAR